MEWVRENIEYVIYIITAIVGCGGISIHLINKHSRNKTKQCGNKNQSQTGGDCSKQIQIGEFNINGKDTKGRK